jgi:hypothetical protein
VAGGAQEPPLAAPKFAQKPSQALPTGGNERERFDSRLGAQSNAHTNQRPLASNLLHRYFKEPDDRLFNIADVAKRLVVCGATVYKLCATGALPHVCVINSIRIEGGALNAFIAAQRRRDRQPSPESRRNDPSNKAGSS